jgi:hypothetical protein
MRGIYQFAGARTHYTAHVYVIYEPCYILYNISWCFAPDCIHLFVDGLRF